MQVIYKIFEILKFETKHGLSSCMGGHSGNPKISGRVFLVFKISGFQNCYPLLEKCPWVPVESALWYRFYPKAVPKAQTTGTYG